VARRARLVVAVTAALACGVPAGAASAWTDPPRRHGQPTRRAHHAPPKPRLPKPQRPQAHRYEQSPSVQIRRVRKLPWRRDGTSLVVHVRTRVVRVYARPHAKRPVRILRKVDRRGTRRAFLVRSSRRGWLQVYLPSRPNGSSGWIRRRAVRIYTNRYRVIVRLRAHRLELWRRRHRVARYTVVVGKRGTPTPRGVFYVVELLKPPDPDGSYGPYSFGISAHSTVLKRFAGGDGRVGVHGTNQPGLLGTSVSHGCIRLANRPIRRLAHILPLGTPVWVRF
jgi:lipoprotein-anchoring transpeptidase ErfK/SrfK